MEVPRIPGYEVEAEIGKGGMGVVYRARHLALDRVVALKIIDPRLSAAPEFVRSFATEARIVARLTHPNLVSVYDFGNHESTYYLSMQYVLGSTVRDLLTQRRPNLDEVVNIVSQVAAALDYAHREQVVHRDIKTGNMLLCPDGKAMLIDFGVAHGAYSESANSVWLAPGTRSYMSPEQCKGHPATPRSDQYSLAVAVYEMLAGHLPFEAPDSQAVMQQHIQSTPAPLTRGRTDITPRLEACVMRAMAKIPEMRFPSVGSFARELEAACREAQALEPILAASKVSQAITAGAVAMPAVGAGSSMRGPVSLVDGITTATPTPTRVANGWIYATRGGDAGRRRYWLWALALVLLCSLGAAAYFAYLKANTPLKKPKIVATGKKKAHSPATRRSRGSGQRYRGRETGSAFDTADRSPSASSEKADGGQASPKPDSTDQPADNDPGTSDDDSTKSSPAEDKSEDSGGGTD
jgi:predicted Ser/Thr protein kinase